MMMHFVFGRPSREISQHSHLSPLDVEFQDGDFVFVCDQLVIADRPYLDGSNRIPRVRGKFFLDFRPGFQQ